MDTGTHFAMGIGLGGLATLDPALSDPITAQAVVIGAIIGSQAPDFDTILKLKNNAVYIRNHRGITHSIPAVLLWPILISGGIYLLIPQVNLLHLWLWTFLAVFLHVFVDIFNAYGTQALRPFTNKWVALGIINTFDPFIFISHLIAICIWIYTGEPGFVFLSLYIVTVFYYLARGYSKKIVRQAVLNKIPDAQKIIISPTYRYNRWHIAVETKDKYYVAKAVGTYIEVLDVFKNIPVPDSSLVFAAKKDENLSAFLSFSPIFRWETEEYDEHLEVRFIDLRYRSKGYYPFVAVVQLNSDLEIMSSYTGWIFSEEKLRKKLELLAY